MAVGRTRWRVGESSVVAGVESTTGASGEVDVVGKRRWVGVTERTVAVEVDYRDTRRQHLIMVREEKEKLTEPLARRRESLLADAEALGKPISEIEVFEVVAGGRDETEEETEDRRCVVAKSSSELNGDFRGAVSLLLPGVGESAATY